MKKLLLAGLVGTSMFTASCSSAKKAQNSQGSQNSQEQRAEFLKLKGDWEIVSIDYDKGLKIKPFDEGADAQCFVGSHWRLIPNNYTGAYTLSGRGTCPSLTQPIKFEVKSGNSFMFKKIAADTKAKENSAGYTLTLVKRDTDQFSLEQDVPFDGSTVRVVYNFERTGMK